MLHLTLICKEITAISGINSTDLVEDRESMPTSYAMP